MLGASFFLPFFFSSPKTNVCLLGLQARNAYNVCQIVTLTSLSYIFRLPLGILYFYWNSCGFSLGDVHQVYLRWVTCHHGNHRTCKYENTFSPFPFYVICLFFSHFIWPTWKFHCTLKNKCLLLLILILLQKKHLALILLLIFLFIVLLLYWGHTNLSEGVKNCSSIKGIVCDIYRLLECRNKQPSQKVLPFPTLRQAVSD